MQWESNHWIRGTHHVEGVCRAAASKKSPQTTKTKIYKTTLL